MTTSQPKGPLSQGLRQHSDGGAGDYTKIVVTRSAAVAAAVSASRPATLLKRLAAITGEGPAECEPSRAPQHIHVSPRPDDNSGNSGIGSAAHSDICGSNGECSNRLRATAPGSPAVPVATSDEQCGVKHKQIAATASSVSPSAVGTAVPQAEQAAQVQEAQWSSRRPPKAAVSVSLALERSRRAAASSVASVAARAAGRGGAPSPSGNLPPKGEANQAASIEPACAGPQEAASSTGELAVVSRTEPPFAAPPLFPAPSAPPLPGGGVAASLVGGMWSEEEQHHHQRPPPHWWGENLSIRTAAMPAEEAPRTTATQQRSQTQQQLISEGLIERPPIEHSAMGGSSHGGFGSVMYSDASQQSYSGRHPTHSQQMYQGGPSAGTMGMQQQYAVLESQAFGGGIAGNAPPSFRVETTMIAPYPAPVLSTFNVAQPTIALPSVYTRGIHQAPAAWQLTEPSATAAQGPWLAGYGQQAAPPHSDPWHVGGGTLLVSRGCSGDGTASTGHYTPQGSYLAWGTKSHRPAPYLTSP